MTPTASTCAGAGPKTPPSPSGHLFEEIKAFGFPGCLNLLHKYINQGRADAERSHISPRRLARMILTRPDNLKAEHRDLLARITAACPEMTQPAAVIGGFAELLTPCAGNARRTLALDRPGLPQSIGLTCTPSPGAWSGTSTP